MRSRARHVVTCFKACLMPINGANFWVVWGIFLPIFRPSMTSFCIFRVFFTFSVFLILLLFCYSIHSRNYGFPYIPDDFGGIDSASFNFDGFDFGTNGTEAVQSGVGTSATTRAIKTTGTIGRASPHPSDSMTDQPRLF